MAAGDEVGGERGEVLSARLLLLRRTPLVPLSRPRSPCRVRPGNRAEGASRAHSWLSEAGYLTLGQRWGGKEIRLRPFPRPLETESATTEAHFHPRWGPGAGSGSWPPSGSPVMAWHQHLDCRLLLLLSKAVLKGDGFLIEIQSIGAKAGRAQHECTSGEIALGRVCVCWRGGDRSWGPCSPSCSGACE